MANCIFICRFCRINFEINFVSSQQHLLVGAGETRMAIHRSKRWYDATEMALGYTLVCWT